MKKFTAVLMTLALAGAASISAAAAYELEPYAVPSNGVHFSFDNTYASDDGTLTGVPKGTVEFTEGHDGTKAGAIYLDTAEDHVELLKEDYWGNWTISAWVRTDEVVPYAFLTMSEGASVRTVQGGNVLGEVGVSVHGVQDYMCETALPLGEWAMLTMAHDDEAGSLTVYLNGEQQETMDVSLPLALTLIGNDSADCRGWMIDPYMALDDLWMFGRVLSPEEVTMLYTENTLAAPEEEPAEEPVAEPAEEPVAEPTAAPEEEPAAEPVPEPEVSVPETADEEKMAPQTSDVSVLWMGMFAVISFLGSAFLRRKNRA